jgi:hypothetical protein
MSDTDARYVAFFFFWLLLLLCIYLCVFRCYTRKHNFDTAMPANREAQAAFFSRMGIGGYIHTHTRTHVSSASGIYVMSF